MSNDYVSPPVSFQELIRKASESDLGEAERSMDLRIEIRTHGKPSHLWKIALRLSRHIRVIFGDGVIFMTMGNDEIIDVPDAEIEAVEDDATRPLSKLEEEARAVLRRAGVGELGG